MQTPYPPPPNRPTNLPLQAASLADQGTERALSALAHGAIAFGFLGFGFLVSLAIAGIIWLYSKRSPEVRFHSEQAGCYQCSVLLINLLFVVVLGVGGGFSIVGILQGNGAELARWVVWGLVIFAIWFIASILYGIVAAIMVLLGKRFKYPIIGDRFEKKVW
ncbi:MAG: DUF4870 domain-containing protein [Chloroflexota bacterium]